MHSYLKQNLQVCSPVYFYHLPQWLGASKYICHEMWGKEESVQRLLSCRSSPCLGLGEKKQLKLSFDIQLEKQQIALEREAGFFFSFCFCWGVLILPRALLAWRPVSMPLPAFGVQPCRSFCSRERPLLMHLQSRSLYLSHLQDKSLWAVQWWLTVVPPNS